MIVNLGCLSLELEMKWNIKPFWKRKAKVDDAVEDQEDKIYYYISYNNMTEEEFLGSSSGSEDLHYACSSPTSSCSHGDCEDNEGYEEIQQEARPRQSEFWTIPSELLLVEC